MLERTMFQLWSKTNSYFISKIKYDILVSTYFDVDKMELFNWSHFEISFMRSVPNDFNHLFTVCNQIRQKFITLQKSIHRRQNFLHQVKQNKFFQTTDS